MFSGIIQTTKPILSAETRGACRRVRVRMPAGWKLRAGQSIAIDGICSTVVARTAAYFDVEYMPETLEKATARSFANGTIVNLERSLKLVDYVDGHLVAGHVDARGHVIARIDKGSSREIVIAVPRALTQFIALKGSIAINGVALAVTRASKGTVAVALIPYTIAKTNLGRLKKGDVVNVEVDLFARYVAAMATYDTVSAYATKRARKKN